MPFFQKGIQKCIKRGSKLDKKMDKTIYLYIILTK